MATANELRKKYHDTYKTLLGRNIYDQNLRNYVYTSKNGKYYSDCSSSICATMNKIGIKMGLLNTAGIYNSKLWKEIGVTVKNGHVVPNDIPKLRVGDALMFRGNDPSRPQQIGHIESVFEVNGTTEDKIILAGHGSGNPSTKNMKAYCTSRENAKASNGKSRGLVCVLRAIQDDGSSDYISYTRNGLDYSPVFDTSYYANKYPDLKAAFGNDKEKLFQHFLTYGIKEGRQAVDSFNVLTYKLRYSDLQKAFGNNLSAYYKHYIDFGKKEGRKGN